MPDPRTQQEILGLPSSLVDPGRCLVMGVLNVTPDSFSDGGRWIEVDAAVRHGLDMVAAGADLIDVGGESTRPGAERITADEEERRVLGVVSGLAEAGVVVSIDTLRASTARAAMGQGAAIVNDVSGGLADPEMAPVVAEAGVPYILMHWRGPSDVMDAMARYQDVVEDVRRELADQLGRVVSAGVDERSVILDPGFGFAKNAEQNWRVLARLSRFTSLGRPVMVGTARKRFLAKAVAHRPGTDGLGARIRDAATAATSVIAAQAGAWAVRVHDVAASADAVRVVALVTEAGAEAASEPAGEPG